ncbi:Mor transcription activator family protein [Marinobacter sp. OP 3.4]|uniref:Mor transcription activator family protein n=1 Tax=Marinobacter sp. OP 3.4 TaxID=3076501 RepID=UPI002E207C25
MTDWDTDYLPTSLKELIDVIGLEATQALVSVYGGTRLTVPAKMRDDHPLAELLGVEAARTLSQHYALERVDVPTGSAATKAARNRKMREEHQVEGISVRRLALRYRLTERRVWEILAESVPDDRQADMFNES